MAMKKVGFVPVMLTDKSDIYSIRIDDDKDTELRKFIVIFKDNEDDYLKDDFDRILAAIEKIAQNGALESYFFEWKAVSMTGYMRFLY